MSRTSYRGQGFGALKRPQQATLFLSLPSWAATRSAQPHSLQLLTVDAGGNTGCNASVRGYLDLYDYHRLRKRNFGIAFLLLPSHKDFDYLGISLCSLFRAASTQHQQPIAGVACRDHLTFVARRTPWSRDYLNTWSSETWSSPLPFSPLNTPTVAIHCASK
jgi:hypothetical protein